MAERAMILPPLRRTAADAAKFASIVHEGQTDKAGRPYITHPSRVAHRVAIELAADCPFWTYEETDEAEQIAWLHDVVEDAGVPPQRLEREGFSPAVVTGVMRLTRSPRSVTYSAFIASIAACDDLPTILVKLADVTDNSDADRLAILPEPERETLPKRYARAKEALQAAARAKGWRG